MLLQAALALLLPLPGRVVAEEDETLARRCAAARLGNVVHVFMESGRSRAKLLLEQALLLLYPKVRTVISIRHTSHVTRHASHVTRHTSHATRHTSHITRHTSHVTRHTSHATRHTSHVTRHLQDIMHGRHTVQYKAEVVCDASMQLLPLRVKAAYSSVLAAAACAPSMANPSMVPCCCCCCCCRRRCCFRLHV